MPCDRHGVQPLLTELLPLSTFRNITFLLLLLWQGSGLTAQVNFGVDKVSVDPAFTGNQFSFNLTLYGSTETDVMAEPFEISQTPYNGSLYWFCLAPLKDMYYNTLGGGFYNTYTLQYASTSFANFNNPASPATDIGTMVANTKADYLATLFTQNNPLTANTTTLAALQLAVWEIANDSGFNLSTGNFTAALHVPGNTGATAIFNSAQTMLNNVQSALSFGDRQRLAFLVDGTASGFDPFTGTTTVNAQDLVGFFPPIPESAHFAWGAAAALCLGIIVRRRSKRSAPVVAP